MCRWSQEASFSNKQVFGLDNIGVKQFSFFFFFLFAEVHSSCLISNISKYSRIWLVHKLWSSGGQTHRWRHYQWCLFCFFNFKMKQLDFMLPWAATHRPLPAEYFILRLQTRKHIVFSNASPFGRRRKKCWGRKFFKNIVLRQLQTFHRSNAILLRRANTTEVAVHVCLMPNRWRVIWL